MLVYVVFYIYVLECVDVGLCGILHIRSWMCRCWFMWYFVVSKPHKPGKTAWMGDHWLTCRMPIPRFEPRLQCEQKKCFTTALSSPPCTVLFLNFWTPENFAVNYLKFKPRGQALEYFCPKGANGIANSEDPDQTAPLGAVWSGVCTVCPDLSVRKLRGHYDR